MRIQTGSAVGHYTILGFLAAGGMGEVYRARDPRLGRDVAIKVLGSAPDADRLARFEREARAAAILAHPNILTIFDIGTHDGLPFLVTELLEGETLRARLASGPLAPRVAVETALQLVRGVAAAHALKIVHRDLKPENLFLTRDGTLKILDFGLAKLKPETFAGGDTLTLDATAAGTIVGTPAYMAPEQLRGDPTDERADLFSVGAIVYEMLAGRGPHRKPSVAETVGAILHEPPAPIEMRGDLPPTLQRVILRCLEKDPSERFQSARDLVFALEMLHGELRRPPAAGGVVGAPGAAVTSASAKGAAADAPTSIAVLPFADMSPARDQDYLCEGIAEELINSLTHVEGLRVAARSSSFQFRTSAVDIQAVGARLGVAAVLEGSVRKAGDRLRVTVQLVDVANGYHRWSQRYDRSLEDVFAIQDEIAESVATALRGILTAREKKALRRPETAIEVYEYFLRGRRLLHRFNRASLQEARRMFERAIELDQGYGPAHAGLAEVHSSLFEWWGGTSDDFDTADRASRKALELAPHSDEAQTSRGAVLAARRKYEEAEKEFQKAIEINPNSFDAHYHYARTAFAWGRVERSAELFQKAAEVRQEDFQSMILLGQSLRVLGKSEEALKAGREGVRRAERQLELDPADARALSLGANALDDIGERERALQWSRRALELYPEDQSVLINGACLRARAGLKEEAIELLERSFARGWGKRDWIEHDPDYDSIRDDPRFKALIEKLR
jgi:non-specific serine/threonine protein kinase